MLIPAMDPHFIQQLLNIVVGMLVGSFGTGLLFISKFGARMAIVETKIGAIEKIEHNIEDIYKLLREKS